jgi:UDP-N-acetyl-D-galactosamine dehydrogenase
MLHEYNFGLHSQPEGKYDAIIVAVNHKEYVNLPESYFKDLLVDEKGVFVDIKGIYRNKINELEYWSL